jgi:hypothetical protein
MDILYHYCSSAAFHEIVDQRAIRLSSLSLSNDTLEGKLVARTLARLAEQDRLPAHVIQEFVEFVGISERIIDGLGFCLSEEGDLLSQWRGYADDATGVAIGFSRAYLEWLGTRPPLEVKLPETLHEMTRVSFGFSVDRVRYSQAEQEDEVRPTYQEMKPLISKGAFVANTVRGLLTSEEQHGEDNRKREQLLHLLTDKMVSLFPKLFALKSPAFSEEKEWRLLSTLLVSLPKCQYRTKQDRVIPYRTYKLVEPGRQPIVEVILGPKHISPRWIIDSFLRHHGFNDVLVKRSEASYR